MKGDKRRYRKGTIVTLRTSVVRDVFTSNGNSSFGWKRALGNGTAEQTALTLVEYTWCDNRNGSLARIPVILSTGEVSNLLICDLLWPHQVLT